MSLAFLLDRAQKTSLQRTKEHTHYEHQDQKAIMSDVNSPGGQPSGANTPKARSQTTKTRTATSLRHQHSHPQHSMDSATAEATCKKLVSVLALDAGYEGITASALESLTRVFENCKDMIAKQACFLSGKLWQVFRRILHDNVTTKS